MTKENIVVKGSAWTERDIKCLFGDEPVHFTTCADIPSLMVEVGAFKSKTQARQAGRDGGIPEGFTEFRASKKMRLWIWNPGI